MDRRLRKQASLAEDQCRERPRGQLSTILQSTPKSPARPSSFRSLPSRSNERQAPLSCTETRPHESAQCDRASPRGRLRH